MNEKLLELKEKLNAILFSIEKPIKTEIKMEGKVPAEAPAEVPAEVPAEAPVEKAMTVEELKAELDSFKEEVMSILETLTSGMVDFKKVTNEKLEEFSKQPVAEPIEQKAAYTFYKKN